MQALKRLFSYYVSSGIMLLATQVLVSNFIFSPCEIILRKKDLKSIRLYLMCKF